ncbi:MAG: hypothetical protein ACXQTG_04000 [Methanoculleaceae archaeon]
MPFPIGAPLPMYAMVAATIAIIYHLTRVTKAVPSSLVAIITVPLPHVPLPHEPATLPGQMFASASRER